MAEKLIDAGLTNIAELRTRKYSVMLGRGQKVGVQYLEHLDKPVSREEAETVAVKKFTYINKHYHIYTHRNLFDKIFHQNTKSSSWAASKSIHLLGIPLTITLRKSSGSCYILRH